MVVSSCVTLHGKEVYRDKKLKDVAFFRKVINGDPEGEVVVTKKLVPGKLAVIGFTKGWGLTEYNLLVHVLVEKKEGMFDHVIAESCGWEGGPPQVLSVFVVHGDKSGQPDLAVLCKWPLQHADVSGTIYGVEFYRLTQTPLLSGLQELTSLTEEFNNRFETCDCTDRDSSGLQTKRRSDFKTAESVIRLLQKMGIPQ